MQNESVEDLCLIIGSNIRHFRVKKNLRQADLAVLAGITKTTVSNIELGLVWPEYDSLKAIMNTLEMFPSDLTSQAFRETDDLLKVAEDTDGKVKLKKVDRTLETEVPLEARHH